MRLNSNLARACVMNLTTPSRRFCDLGVVVLLVVSDEAVGKSRRSHLSNPVQQDENKKSASQLDALWVSEPTCGEYKKPHLLRNKLCSPFTVVIEDDLQPG